MALLRAQSFRAPVLASLIEDADSIVLC